MSNFLSNLIARAAQRAPVLERRRSALFEPATTRAGPVPGTIDQAGELSVEAPTVAHPHAIRTVAGNATGEQPDTLAPVVQNVPQRSVPERKSRGPLLRTAPLRVADVRTIEAALPAAAHAEQVTAIAEPAYEVGAEDHPGRSPDPVLPKIDALAHRSSLASRTSIASQARPIDDSETRRRPRAEPSQAEVRRPPRAIVQVLESGDAGSNLLAPTAPRIARAVQLAKATQPGPGQRSSATMNREPTSVQITIGRVEVRAMTAGERSAARAQPAAPRLTLDDYMRERNKGAQ